jgi:capsular exopolysaccharide synthesis family protein
MLIDPLPVLGVIPSVGAGKRTGLRPQADGWPDFDGEALEAFRSLRTSIQLLGVDRPLGVFQFTSPLAGEGKTTTVSNLGLVLASAGQRVIVIDCDLRRPRLNDTFGLPRSPGLVSVLSGDVSLADAIRPVPQRERLALLAAGPLPPNPSELLGSKRVSQLIFQLQSEFDLVLLDSPPVLPITDAAVLSRWVDATVLVAAEGKTTRSQLQAALQVLRQVDAPLAGVVLNRARAEGGYGYGYGYPQERTDHPSGPKPARTPMARVPERG